MQSTRPQENGLDEDIIPPTRFPAAIRSSLSDVSVLLQPANPMSTVGRLLGLVAQRRQLCGKRPMAGSSDVYMWGEAWRPGNEPNTR
jgi:hypothetical protein